MDLIRSPSRPAVVPALVACLLAVGPAIVPAFAQSAATAGGAAAARAPADPVVADPARVDSAFPPRSAELAFESAGDRLNGFMYVAGGRGPHPTAVLLHGFPGNERNLDLGQALRRAGWNVLFFSYRGAWGDGGTFSLANALADVGAALRFVRSDSAVRAWGGDPARVVLVGHSMGGWLALMGAAADSSVSCTVALDYWNVGADGRAMRDDPHADSAFASYAQWLTAPGAPLRADAADLTREIESHADAWDAVRSAPALRTRPLLVLSTTRNDEHRRLVDALRAANDGRAARVTAAQWRTDHNFSDRRIELARTVVRWLAKECRR